MHHVQEIAVGLFVEHGFDAVSIEQIAEAAEVSPSTIYRYFGTKEGLVIRDEYDDPFLTVLSHYLTQGEDLAGAFTAALDSIWEEHFVVEEASTRARMHLWLDVPSVRAASYLIIDEHIDDIARVLATTDRWSFSEARIIVSGIVWSFVAALRNWHDLDADGDWREHLTGLIARLAPMTPPDPPHVPGPDARADEVASSSTRSPASP